MFCFQVSSSESKKGYEKSNATGKKESTKYSDDEESDEDEIKIIPKQPSKVLKVLTFFATLLKIILMPMCLLFLIFACTKVSWLLIYVIELRIYFLTN